MRRKSKLNRLPPFVPLTWDLLNSPAYKKLTFSAAKALPYFLGKVKIHHGDTARYDTRFTFSYPEAEKLGFATATFSRITKELVLIGFIDFWEKGGLRGKGEGYNKYLLSKKWETFKEEQTTVRPKGYHRSVADKDLKLNGQRLKITKRTFPNR